jgi:sulfopyruvate decarboxylase TPP-binding subunit
MYKENYLVDDSGKRIAVMLPIKEYNKMLDAIEELEDIKAYDLAKNEETIPLREAIKLRKQKNA